MPKVTIKQNNKNLQFFLNKNNENPSFIDVLITYYPLDKSITSDNFKFLPYEEYVDDVDTQKRSAYKLMPDSFNKLFGLASSFLLGLIFYIVDSSLLISVEAVVSLLGFYIVGKEVWIDFDNFLQYISRNWRVKWLAQEYGFQRMNFGTIQSFWQYARDFRNQSTFALADKFDYVVQSNSQALELRFEDLEEDSHILTIDNASLKGLLGVKLTVGNTIFGFISFRNEYFQAVMDAAIGTIKDDGWEESTVLTRRTVIVGRLKFYLSSKTFIAKKSIVSIG